MFDVQLEGCFTTWVVNEKLQTIKVPLLPSLNDFPLAKENDLQSTFVVLVQILLKICIILKARGESDI